nr:hypothetical protein [uncultured Methanobacterium sp.]
MTKKDPNIIIEKLQSTLTKKGVDYEGMIEELGQVEDKSKSREELTLNDHVKGMIHAMLSNNRPWAPIEKNMYNIDKIFLNYDPDKLEKADPQELVEQIEDIGCGNRSINSQMKHLKYNINQLRIIEEDYGAINNFLTIYEPLKMAKLLSNPSKYKIKQFGLTLAMEYLKNVGIDAIEPNVHVIRICGPERLAIFSENKIDKIIKSFEDFSDATGYPLTYLDNIFYIFGAKNYGDVCTATPKCDEDKCELIDCCNYPKNHPLED